MEVGEAAYTIFGISDPPVGAQMQGLGEYRTVRNQ
jgi:hypothetical protein